MEGTNAEIVTLLQTRVRQLILQHKELQAKYDALEAKFKERESDIQTLEELNKETLAQYANLKVAKTLELSDNDTRSAKLRLNKLVRDVDACIALLKS